MDVPRRGGDDAGRYRAAQTKRVADRQHPVANFCLCRIPPGDRRQWCFRLDLEKGEIGHRVPPDNLGL